MKKVLLLLLYALFASLSTNAQDASFIFTCDRDASERLFNSTETVFRLDIGEKARFFTIDGMEVKDYNINYKQIDGSRMFFFFEDADGHQGCVSVAMDVNSVGIIDKTIQDDAFMLKLDLNKTRAYNAKKHSNGISVKINKRIISGSWKATEVESDGEMIKLNNIGDEYELNFIFNSNGNYRQSGFVGDFTGIYSIDGDCIDVYSIYGDKYITFKVISISDDVATVIMRVDGDVNSYKFIVRKRDL